MTQLDPSGMFRFLTDELQDAEDAGERGACPANILRDLTELRYYTVWIMGHVLTGWDGTNPLVNPSNFCAYNVGISLMLS
jgi:sphingomyelin phosphodiesterase